MSKTHRIALLILFLKMQLGCQLNSTAQISPGNLEDYLYNQIYKNIAAFNIANPSPRDNGLIKVNILRSNSDQYYDAFLADFGYKLQMKIEKSNWKYPDERYELFKVTVDKLQYNSVGDSTSIQYVNRGTDKNFLVGIDLGNGEVKFISGQFFLSTITDDFKIQDDKPDTYITYLKFRLYRYQIDSIRFVRKRRRVLIFRGVSPQTTAHMLIYVSLRNREFPQLVQCGELTYLRRRLFGKGFRYKRRYIRCY